MGREWAGAGQGRQGLGGGSLLITEKTISAPSLVCQPQASPPSAMAARPAASSLSPLSELSRDSTTPPPLSLPAPFCPPPLYGPAPPARLRAARPHWPRPAPPPF